MKRDVSRGLSAWESDRSESVTAVILATDVPVVTAMDPQAPGLIARQWPRARLLPALPAAVTSRFA